ncbi:uncharacterized protein LOC142175984 [Nicotiana tabacum]|uniref:Uncharacterized protein LOC142175984 n=1 Tax=Nicotiana tabacum TaxID=4097 RepID=A0AC58TPE1_TOBAC
MTVVKENWKADFFANPFTLFNYKEGKEGTFNLEKSNIWGHLLEDIKERLHNVQADLFKFLALKEEFWKQKAGMTWFQDGDRNTIFFHVHINGRRKRLQLKRIQDGEGNWLEDTVAMAEEADIIGDDVIEMVKAFFSGQELPRVIHERLAGLLPSLISDEQAGFVKGRIIVENVLLMQEIITNIRLRTKEGPNVVMKRNMTKAYNRLSWLFLTKVLRKMGFCERFIRLIFGIVSNNWYSVLINGQPYGFFKSTRGVKQEDPLSPTLFILAAKALSRGLNALHLNLYFCGFGLPKWSPNINHLAYADDTIIFSSSDFTSVQLIMEVIYAYEVARQLINKSKSAVYMHHSTDDEVVRKVQRITGIQRREFPFTYLGCPIFYSRRRMNYYEGLMKKILDQLQSWKGGVGFRSPHDMSKMLFYKLWWNFHTKPSLWSSFMSQKYCKKLNGLIVPWRNGSHIWRKMLECRDIIEQQIVWQPKMGSSLFWFDNLTGLGALYLVTPPDFFCDESIHNIYDVESVNHVFFTSYAARRVWSYFFSFAGFALEGLNLHQAIVKCWTAQVIPRLKPIFQALPCIIVGELWKRRNSYKHGEVVSINRVVYQVSITLQSLIKVRKPSMLNVPPRWPDMLQIMENYTPSLKVDKVIWELPSSGWIKINADGAARGNPGRSSYGFCIRYEYGEVIYARGKEIQEGTNTVAEVVTIQEALRYCINPDLTNIWIQTDSMMLKRVITGIWKPPWIIAEDIVEIREMLELCNGTVSHIFREGNKLTEHLANYALDVGDIECHEFHHLDTTGRRTVNVDKLKCPYLRVKVARS